MDAPELPGAGALIGEGSVVALAETCAARVAFQVELWSAARAVPLPRAWRILFLARLIALTLGDGARVGAIGHLVV